MGTAAIFDFDGVIVDSIAIHEAGWRQIAQEDGRPFSRELFERGIGLKNEPFISEVLQWSSNPTEIAAIIARKEKHYQELISNGAIHLIPETIAFIRQLFHAHIPCAIGTSSTQKNLDSLFSRYGELKTFFRTCVTKEDVKRGKPDPEVFLVAARRLETPPSSCVVFEDAPLGIVAAKNGGMKAVALTTTFPQATLQAAHPDIIVNSLATFPVQDFFRSIIQI